MAEPPPVSDPDAWAPLRDSFERLAAELDSARLYKTSAYVSMARDAVGEDLSPRRQDKDLRTDVELELDLDEHGRVWMYRDGDAHMIGRRDAVCAEMRRFLAVVVLGEAR
jgi:hypothetical protein